MFRTSARSERVALVAVWCLLLLPFAAAADEPECSIRAPKRYALEDLPRLAKVTQADAQKRAVAAVAPETPSSITSSGLDVLEGCLVWSFDLRYRGRAGFQEVVIDAGDGKVLSKRVESPNVEETEKAKDAPVALVPSTSSDAPQPAPLFVEPVGVLGRALFVKQGEKVPANTIVATSNACGAAGAKWSASTVYWGGSAFSAGTVGCGKTESREICTQAASPVYTEPGVHTVRINVEASCGGESPHVSDVVGTSFVVVLDKDGRLPSKTIRK